MTDSSKINADLRLKTLIENGATLGHRSLLVVLGSETPEQVMVIHHLMSKALSERPSVLWCHGKGSDVPRQSRKQLKKLEKHLKSGKCDISSENAFHLFLLATPIKYCSYNDTKNVLGNTFGMCVLQDVEGFTPNSLCRVIETVKGGGVIIILSKMTSLRQFFDIQMDVHYKLKTHSHPIITPLFNERMVLSLGWCKSCLILNDQLQVLKELPSLSRTVKPVGMQALEKLKESKKKLTELQESLADGEKPLPQLINCCKTVDQAKAVLKMIDIITDKTGRATVSITAGRGRGKSAALGLAVAAAIYFGQNNIFVTSPSPDNLGTFFEFIFKGFDALEYKEQEDYEIIQSTNVDYNEAIVRVNVFREYRQTIQYIDPTDAKKLSQAELLVIDEAAAIPLPYVKALLGSYIVFMASTTNGYEGTGRSLSLKLLNQLRQQSAGVTTDAAVESTDVISYQSLHEVALKESIRYNDEDPVEKWLSDLFCLFATSSHTYATMCPPPQSCQLYFVNKDVLLSGHQESEDFLQEVMSLLVASHYRNSPDDLQILSDAPAHHLFVLLSPILPGMTKLPTVLAVIQVCLEGNISKAVADNLKSRGERPSGDLAPWTLATQFLDTSLTELIGVRIVRVATHSDYLSMGYGSRAINLLSDYYKGKHISLDDEVNATVNHLDAEQEKNVIVPRHDDKPLLSKLSERQPDEVDYLSVSYGVTHQLFKFWKRAGFMPLYISQVSNKVTGEHSCVMINPLADEEVSQNTSHLGWVKKVSIEFLRRFIRLLGGPLGDIPPTLALAIIRSHDGYLKENLIEWSELKCSISGHDVNRIERYANNLADRNLISDLFPSMMTLFYMKRLPTQLSQLQSELLLGLGLQGRSVDEMVKLMDLPVESLLGQLNRAIRRFLKGLNSIQETGLARSLPTAATKTVAEFTPVDISLQQDLEDAAEEYEAKAQHKKKSSTGKLKLLGETTGKLQKLGDSAAKLQQFGDLNKFAIQGDDSAWEAVLQGSPGDVVTVKNIQKPKRMSNQELERELPGPPPKKKSRGRGRGKMR